MKCIPYLFVIVLFYILFCANPQNPFPLPPRPQVTLRYEGFLNKTNDNIPALSNPYSVKVSPDGKYIYCTGTTSNSIIWFSRDLSTGRPKHEGEVTEDIENVSGLLEVQSLTLSPDGLHVYGAASGGKEYRGAVSWFDRNPQNGSLSFGGSIKEDSINGVSGLRCLTSIVTSKSGKQVYTAAWFGDAITWFDRNSGTGALTYKKAYKNNNDNIINLGAPYCIALSPDDRHLYAACVRKSVVWFERDELTGALQYKGSVVNGQDNIQGLSTPWGITVSPDGKQVYAVGSNTDPREWDDAITWFDRDIQTGDLTFRGCIMRKDISYLLLRFALMDPRAVIVHPSGDAVYCSVGQAHSLAVFNRNKKTGSLSFQGWIGGFDDGLTMGLCCPQEVAISPDGRNVYVAGNNSGALTWFTVVDTVKSCYNNGY